MRLQQTFGIMFASDGAELSTLMRADPIEMYLAFVQDTSFPCVTPAQLHAAAHQRVMQETSRQGSRAVLREPWTSIARPSPLQRAAGMLAGKPRCSRCTSCDKPLR